MSDTPVHDKLQKIQHLSQAIGEFLDWADEQGWHLAEWNTTHFENFDFMQPVGMVRTEILARHFDIDLNALEDEKLVILEQIREKAS